MGGEPYRIMELKPFIGIERATSSVILYVMMHIFSHFCFWLTSVLLYVCLYPVGWVMSVILGAITLFCLLVTVLFIKGYRHGMAVAFIRMGSRLPFLKKKVNQCSINPVGSGKGETTYGKCKASFTSTELHRQEEQKIGQQGGKGSNQAAVGKADVCCQHIKYQPDLKATEAGKENSRLALKNDASSNLVVI